MNEALYVSILFYLHTSDMKISMDIKQNDFLSTVQASATPQPRKISEANIIRFENKKRFQSTEAKHFYN